MRQFLLLALFFFTVLVSCSSDDEIVIKKGIIDDIPSSDKTNNDSEDSITIALNVILTGRDSYEDMSVSVVYDVDLMVNGFQKVNGEGEISFDVTNQIGKDLTIMVYENENSIPHFIEGTEITITNIQADKSISINIPPKKIYAANISVIKDDKPQESVKVYVLDSVSFDMFSPNLEISGLDLLESAQYAITNDKGVAEFDNIKIPILSNKYHFIVIIKEGIGLLERGLEYQGIVLSLDGTLKEDIIEVESVKSGQVTFNLETLFPNGIKIDLNNDDLVSTFETKVAENATVSFTDIPIGIYYAMISKNDACFSPISKLLIVEILENQTNIESISFEKSLTLTSNSNNPYTVTITCSDLSIKEFTINGNDSKEIDIPLGATMINVKQNSGYLFFPTEKEYSVSIECDNTTMLSFPN